MPKRFDLVTEADDSRVMRDLAVGNVYISAYGKVVKGEKNVEELEVGERTRKTYALSGQKPTTYAIERTA